MIQKTAPWLVESDRLVCFGDSLTAEKPGYVAILEQRLADLKIEVIRAGVGGDKTPKALARLQADVISRNPTAVSIFLGANDAAIGHGVWADEPRVPPIAYATNLNYIVHICRQAGIKKFSIASPVYCFEGPAYADYGDRLRDYCLATRDVADENKVYFVPLDAAFRDFWQSHPGHSGLLLTRDGVHPTEAGYRIIAETMLKAWGVG